MHETHALREQNIEFVNVKRGGTYSCQGTTRPSKAQLFCAEFITLHFAHKAYIRETLHAFFLDVMPCMMLQMHQHFFRKTEFSTFMAEGVVGGVRHLQHTQISSNSSTIAADNSTV